MQTVLITGATSGIGKSTALGLLNKGYTVIATGRNLEALDTLRKEANSSRMKTLRLDVTSLESIVQAVEAVNELTNDQGIDVLVNNAGYNQSGPVEMVSDADTRAQFDTNFFGLLNVTRAFIPKMRAKGHGKIINVSSIVGRISTPLTGIYNASKFALEAASDALRVELKSFGISVVLVEPGMTKTALGDKTMNIMSTYADSASPYFQVMQELVKKRVEYIEKTYADVSTVSDVIVKAIEAKQPRARYIPGNVNKLMVGTVKATPTLILDAVLGVATGLSKKRSA